MAGPPPNNISVISPAFAQGKPIPSQYSKVKNISPPLRIGNLPLKSESLVLIVDDPDAPAGLWTHWLMWNIPASTAAIPEGETPPGAMQGKNSFGDTHYDGPAPPSGTHRYYFHIYALDTPLALATGSDRAALEAAMANHVLATGETFGTYSASP